MWIPFYKCGWVWENIYVYFLPKWHWPNDNLWSHYFVSVDELEELIFILMSSLEANQWRNRHKYEFLQFIHSYIEMSSYVRTLSNFKGKIWTWTGTQTRTSRSLAWCSTIKLSRFNWQFTLKPSSWNNMPLARQCDLWP